MTTAPGGVVHPRPSVLGSARSAVAPHESRLLTVAAGTGIVSSIAVMIVASLNPGSWLPPNLVMPAIGPPWDVPSLRIPVPVIASALWLAALAGGGGVAAGLVAVRRGARVSPRLLIGTGLISVTILTVLPPAGSIDILDYATFGHMVTLGHTPYVWTPIHLRVPGNPFGRSVPAAWDTHVTLYGPLATFEQFVAAVLGGSSAARIVFWLKLWNAITFMSVALVADRILRTDPAGRLRAHLLWTVNPLLLWALIAGGHIDMMAAGVGLLGLLILGTSRDAGGPTFARAIWAGFFLGAAADIKIPYLLFVIGAVWTLRRSPAAMLGTAGAALAVLVPTYLWFGPPAVDALLARTNKMTPDTLYRLLSSPEGPVLEHLLEFAVGAVVILALLTMARLPRAARLRPVLRSALALSLAWLFVWPYQLPWYDAMIVCLLILYPASRLDWLVLTRLTAGTIAMIPGVPKAIGHITMTFVVPGVLLACVVGLVYLCVTGHWRTGRTAIPASSANSTRPVST